MPSSAPQKQDLQNQYQAYHIRLLTLADVDNYYQNFPLDREIIKLTGSHDVNFSYQHIKDFLHYSLSSDRHFCFVLISADGDIVGESVINDVDYINKKANFRIVIFDKQHQGKGLGVWATYHACRYAFEVLKLNRLELSVFDFNTTAQACYHKVGFKHEGVMRQTLWLDDEKRFADEYMMAILAHEWQANKRLFNPSIPPL